MKQSNQFLNDMLDLDAPQAAGDRVWIACQPTDAVERGGDAVVMIPFQAQQKNYKIQADTAIPQRVHELRVRAYGDDIVRLTLKFGEPAITDESPMLAWHPTLKPSPLKVRRTAAGWEIVDRRKRVRLAIDTRDAAARTGQTVNTWPLPFEIEARPDGKIPVPFITTDRFVPQCVESFALGYVARAEAPHRAMFSLHAAHGEHFCGTGERFARMDLAGRTFALENADGLGVNNRRCYKNVPFYMSSRPYGLFMHTHAHVRLSLADVSTRAAQGVIEEPALDLFVIGGGSLERILYNYRRITGFPPTLPDWSYGIWMSRMSYRAADEVRAIAARLRRERFPCDVLHLDVGWFDKEWNCDWAFGSKNFPEPEKFMAEMRAKGFRITLWQLPHVGKTTSLYQEAVARKFAFVTESAGKISESIFSGLEHVATIDFTNPAAVAWYQGLLADLLRKGAAAIKCDFGEHIHMDVDYQTMPGRRLHNLFPLLYQKAAFEITQSVRKEGIIWARSGWAGAQRYPLHWGGDCAASWDGLAGTIRGGLHLGLSGFAFWSHDVPGFHGVPDFMQSWPADEIYVRWTQAGTFTSHMRYHGAQPREPYEYPAIADLVRRWWRLRYALIPYLIDESRAAVKTGQPVLGALVLRHEDDPQCWHIDDQFYCGGKLLVAPVLNSSGIRDVYLPAGEWVDLWTGRVHKGPQWLRKVRSPLERIPVFAKRNAAIRIYPEAVDSTDDMRMRRCVALKFDRAYRGLRKSPLGQLTGL